jgi:hypothetical protein
MSKALAPAFKRILCVLWVSIFANQPAALTLIVLAVT